MMNSFNKDMKPHKIFQKTIGTIKKKKKKVHPWWYAYIKQRKTKKKKTLQLHTLLLEIGKTKTYILWRKSFNARVHSRIDSLKFHWQELQIQCMTQVSAYRRKV